MPLKQLIEETLRAELTPDVLQVEDESAQHAGHAGWREGGETHFHLTIASENFAGLSRVARHRLIHRALGDVMQRLHALRITIED